MNKPLVTVKMSAFNHEKYVERAILSIVNQTYENIELIVVDDGSTDQTPDILQHLSKVHGFFFEAQPNMGITATYTKILRQYTHGKYVKGCASDDELPTDAIAKMVEYLEKHPDYGACYGNAEVIDQDSQVIGKMIGSGHSGWIHKQVASGVAYVPLQTFMWRADLLRRLGDYNESVITEDIDMFYRVIQSTQIGFVDDFVYRYRQHETNVSKNLWRMYQDSKRIAESRPFADPALQAIFLRRQQLYWFHSLSFEHKREALKYFLPAARFFPSKFFIAGCLNLMGLDGIEKGYRRMKRWLYRVTSSRRRLG